MSQAPIDQRLGGLDGLRAFAVGMVIVHNFGSPPGFARLGTFTSLPGGFVGVTLFFVLSGFLITHRLIGEFGTTGRFSFQHFLVRRARRLLPALGVALALLIAANIRNGVAVRETAIATLSAFFYVFNLVSIGRSLENPVGGIGWGPLWSLSVEEQFYLIAPVPIMWLWRKTRPVTSLVFICTLTLASAGLTAVLWMRGASFGRLYLATDVRVQSLLLGVALAMIWHHQPDIRRFATRRPSFTVGVCSLVLTMSALFVSGTNSRKEPTWILGPGLFVTSVVCAVLVANAVSLSTGSRVSGLLNSRPITALGQRSYGLYLFHLPIVALLKDLPGAWVISLAGTLATAWASYRFIERPAMGYRRASLEHGRSAGSSL